MSSEQLAAERIEFASGERKTESTSTTHKAGSVNWGPINIASVVVASLLVVGIAVGIVGSMASSGPTPVDNGASEFSTDQPTEDPVAEAREDFRRHLQGFGPPIESRSDAESACMVEAASSSFSQDQCMAMLGYE